MLPEWLRTLDHTLFFWLNGRATCDFLDWFMPFITQEWTWAPFIAAGWIGLLVSRRPGHRQLALALLVAIGLTDLLGSRVLKPMCGRQRPCIAMPDKVILRVGRSGSPSFPSNHAANTGAAAATLAFMGSGPVPTAALGVLAVVIAWSRVYVGVHYPLDVVVGAGIGILVAFAVTRALLAIHRRWWGEATVVMNNRQVTRDAVAGDDKGPSGS